MSVIAHDIGTYLVSSRSNKETHHIVDVNELTCSCPAFMEFSSRDAENPCVHLEAALAFHHRSPR